MYFQGCMQRHIDSIGAEILPKVHVCIYIFKYACEYAHAFIYIQCIYAHTLMYMHVQHVQYIRAQYITCKFMAFVYRYGAYQYVANGFMLYAICSMVDVVYE